MSKNSNRLSSVVVEGLPGSGKTSIAEAFCKTHDFVLLPEHVLVPELFSSWNASMQDNERLYLLHWEVKSALFQTFNTPCLFDRNHVTALAYNYARSKLIGNARIFQNVLSWYHDAIDSKKIFEPNVYILLDIDTNVSRLRKPQDLETNPVWSQSDGLQLTKDFYDSIEDYVDVNRSGSLVHRIDARRSMGDVESSVKRIIEKYV